MTPAAMKKLLQKHSAAVNSHDLDAVMATFHEDCYVEDLAFGLRVEGKTAVERYYERLFSMLPDAAMNIEAWAFGDDVVVAWGTYRVTVPSLFLGLTGAGRAVEITSGLTMATVKDGLVQGQRIFLNLGAICDEAGVSLDKVRGAVRSLMA
jgi:steroid delta-isomerase-like uncharacterized protein